MTIKKKILLFACIGIMCHSTYGQGRFSLPFSGAYDEDAPILLGISYTASLSHYLLQLKDDWQGLDILPNGEPGKHILDIENIRAIQSRPALNISVGIPIDIRFTELLYFTLNPSFNFVNQSQIDYSGEAPGENGIEKTVFRRSRHSTDEKAGQNFNSFTFPLHIKFRSEEKVLKNRFNRYRAYLIGGVSYTRWLGIKKEYGELIAEQKNGYQSHALILNPDYYTWEAGVGLDIFFNYFKMSPEIKFSQSFSNILDNNHMLTQGNLYMNPLQSAKARGVFLSLIFQ